MSDHYVDHISFDDLIMAAILWSIGETKLVPQVCTKNAIVEIITDTLSVSVDHEKIKARIDAAVSSNMVDLRYTTGMVPYYKISVLGKTFVANSKLASASPGSYQALVTYCEIWFYSSVIGSPDWVDMIAIDTLYQRYGTHFTSEKVMHVLGNIVDKRRVKPLLQKMLDSQFIEPTIAGGLRIHRNAEMLLYSIGMRTAPR